MRLAATSTLPPEASSIEIASRLSTPKPIILAIEVSECVLDDVAVVVGAGGADVRADDADDVEARELPEPGKDEAEADDA